VVVVVSGTVVVVVELEEVVTISSTEVASELPPQKETSKISIKYLFILK
jgi:hypothetical protein